MIRIIKTFRDGTRLEYDSGKFDDWCVYRVQPCGTRKSPKDVDYFNEIKRYCRIYGLDNVYGDFLKVYDLVPHGVVTDDTDVIRQTACLISQIMGDYGRDTTNIDILLTTLYMAMIAEENKEHSYLGKRIKRLGLHCYLYEGVSVDEATNFMKNQNCHYLEGLCEARGF